MMEQGDFPKRRSFDASLNYEHLVKPVLRNGELVETLPSLVAIRIRTLDQVKRFAKSILRFDNPHIYPCGLEESLYQVKARLIRQGGAAESM